MSTWKPLDVRISQKSSVLSRQIFARSILESYCLYYIRKRYQCKELSKFLAESLFVEGVTIYGPGAAHSNDSWRHSEFCCAKAAPHFCMMFLRNA